VKKIAIIPARGGSKRIPRKNIKSFLGKPIIAYSIEAAIKTNLFDKVMVSTDDDEIAHLAENFGAVVPFMRTEKNSDDHAVLADVVLEVISTFQEQGETFDQVCCLLPTAPFITSERIIKSYQTLVSDELDSVFPVLPFSFPIQRSLEFQEQHIKMVWEEYMNARSQDLKLRYHDAGQYYWLKVESFLEQKKLFMPKSGAIIISELEAQDIDTETDWKLAELKYKLQFNV